MRTPASGSFFTRAPPSQSRANRVGVGCRRVQLAASPVETEERAAGDPRATRRRRHLVEERALGERRVAEQVERRQHRADRHLVLLAELEQLGTWSCPRTSARRARRARRRAPRRCTGSTKRGSSSSGSPTSFRNAGAWRCSAHTPAKPSAQAIDAPDRVHAVAEPRSGRAVERGARARVLEHARGALLRGDVEPVALAVHERAVAGGERRREAVQAEQHPGLVAPVLERRPRDDTGQ